ncbi:la-related 6B [Olea europaea subsp. europaea]|uniref:La-related 6B n=1 Tax=Olea europaea subsp. europaea TaxID=158383 RepID=A0A8S0TX80_OLEEU|nr:la-related 6B [Olea europaea subsp. europaea]
MQTKGIHDPSSGYKPLVNTCSPYNNSRSWSMKSQEVPLSVVASFNKIKNVISGVPQLASILRSSKKLVVSEDGKKVRRQHPLTESDMDELQSRIVIAENLPEDHCHQNLMKIFSSVGSVKSIRTCLPQNSNGGASSRTAKANAVHFSHKLHAFVEYESVELAEKAVVELNDEGNWRNSLKVCLLIKNAVKSAQVRAKKLLDGQSNGEIDEAILPEGQRFKEKHLEDPLQQLDAQPYEYQWEDNAKSNSHRKAHNSINSNGRGKGKGQGRGRPQHHQINGGSLLGSPQLEASVYAEKLIIAKASPVPRMPDGTKGFSMGRGKPVAIPTA